MQARALGQALMLARPLVRVVHRKVRTFFRLRRLQELEKSKNVAVDGKKPLQCVECEGVAILPVLVPPPSSGRPSISSRTKEDCTAAPPLVFCLYCFQQVREDYGLPAAEAGEEGVKYLFLPPAKD
jgi:hypothetical protein